MRLAVVSDLHGGLVALETVVRDLRSQAPDLVVHGGDLAVIGPRPAEVVDRVRELGWRGVVGNTDEMLWRPELHARLTTEAPGLAGWLDVLFHELAPWAAERLGPERLGWLRELPDRWAALGTTVLHASPGNLWRAPPADSDDEELARTYGALGGHVSVYGHIHRPFVRRCGPLTVANSGSVALPWDGDARASYVLVDDGATSVRRVEYDLEASARDARDSGFPRADWLAGLIASARFVRP